MTGRFPLAVLPTPLVPAPRLAAALGRRELWVKRDDLCGFMLAGNKARALEALLAAARAQGADTLVTGGGPRSNYCAAAAAAARLAGLRCVLVLYGDDTGPAHPNHPNLALARWHGAETRFTGDPDRASVDREVVAAADRVRAGGGRPYVAPRGGAGTVGAAAYVGAGAELARQLESAGARPATLLLAAGSGGTAAGLVADAVAGGRPWRVVAAAVSRPPAETAARVLRMATEVAQTLRLPPARAGDLVVLDARGPGYAQPSAEGERATRLAADTEGMLLDPVFSAKALGVLLGSGADPDDPDDPALADPVVFWHGGGQAAALAHLAAPAREAVAP